VTTTDQTTDRHDASEPTDQHRAVARNLFGLYVALCDAGFTDVQALQLVTCTVTATLASEEDRLIEAR
jgi:hypothetical protein